MIFSPADKLARSLMEVQFTRSMQAMPGKQHGGAPRP